MEIWGITLGMAVLWIALAVICIIIEVSTMGLATIWFAGGAATAAVSTIFISNVIVQIIIFLVVSIILLYLTKPMRTKLKIGKEKTNVEAVVGKTGFVMEAISPASFGQVKVGGIMWTAKSQDPSEVIDAGTEITVAAVEGVKLIVKPSYNRGM